MRSNNGLVPQGRVDAQGPELLLPTSMKVFSTYWRSVSANAGSFATSVRSAGAAVAAGVSSLGDERQKEQVRHT